MLRRNVRTLVKLALVALLAVGSTMLTLRMMGPSEDRERSNSLPFNPRKVQFLNTLFLRQQFLFINENFYILQLIDGKSTKEIRIHKKEKFEVQTEAIVNRPKSGQIDWHDYNQIKADSLRKGQ
jgi:hypothetical protein